MPASEGNSQTWRFAFASVMGTSHHKSGDPCQDASACELLTRGDGDDVLIAVACDGAGSARLSQVGSHETCRFVLERTKELLNSDVPVAGLTRDCAERLVIDARENLRAFAAKLGATPRDLACTLVVASDAAMFLQIGDGVVIVGRRDEPIDDFCWVFWPERGEYANTTTFLSDEDVIGHILHEIVLHGIDEIALLTDGIQSLVLDLRGRAAHAPFFARVMAPLRTLSQAGNIASLGESLAAYLDSAPINDRTDDDKTLIIASRRTQTDR
jgi:hypothetical protein